MKQQKKPNIGAAKNVWIIEIPAEHKLKQEAADCLKNLESLDTKAKASVLLERINTTINMMGTLTGSKEISTCASRLNLLIRRLCKDVVQADDENEFMANGLINQVTKLLDDKGFGYSFAQSELRPITLSGNVTEKVFA